MRLSLILGNLTFRVGQDFASQPFTNVRVSIGSITSVNPLLVELIDPFFDPGLTPEEQAFLSARVEQVKVSQADVCKLWQQKTRELSGARRPRGSSITLPDDPEDPILLEIEYEGAGVLLPPYLIFSVTDSITGQSAEQLIHVVPEPGTLLCLGAGLAAAGVRHRRRRKSGAA